MGDRKVHRTGRDPDRSRHRQPHRNSSGCRRPQTRRTLAAYCPPGFGTIAPQFTTSNRPTSEVDRSGSTARHLTYSLAESEQQTMLREVLHTDSARDIVLAFGPEGGWTESELELFGDAGWISASLGNTILRVETAAIAALAVTLSELA